VLLRFASEVEGRKSGRYLMINAPLLPLSDLDATFRPFELEACR
jgi:hypothetical protein